MNNATAIFIYENKSMLLRRYGKLAPFHLLEDCLANIACRLIKSGSEAIKMQSFLDQAVGNELGNQRRNNKKYVEFPTDFIPEAEPVDYDNRLEKILLLLPKLPSGQRAAVVNFLEYDGYHNRCPGNTETQKAQYRNALIKLRELIK